MKGKKLFLSVVFLFLASFIFSFPIHSPGWGFSLDLPEGYVYTGGDGRDRFTFEHNDGARFDLVIYHTEPGKNPPYADGRALVDDVQKRLNNKGEIDSFEYRQKTAYIMELSFALPTAGRQPLSMEGWALCLELGGRDASSTQATHTELPRPLLFAMAYGTAGRAELQILHFSALDSLAPEASDKLAPGPITEYSYPRKNRINAAVFGFDMEALIYREDAEAAQALIEREFSVLRRYANAPNWKEAWIRYYRAIYRDSFDRLADIAFKVERKLNIPAQENRDLADLALKWVQSFKYERDFEGSDFQNLVTAATEGRGDCDSRAMLWAVVIKQAGIPSAIMVSRQFSHAMGLADLPGAGARFEFEGQRLLVAETTASVSIGLIGETVSDIAGWIGISFE